MQERFHATDPDKQAKQLDDFAQQGMEMFVEYMYEHFEEFKLLVNGSYGTKFQNFVEHLVDIETEYTYKFMEATGLHFKGGKPVTKNFMHIMNKALFESFFEVVRHDMSKEEAEEYVVMLENITAPDGTLYTKKAVNHRCIIGLKKENKQTAIVLLCIC